MFLLQYTSLAICLNLNEPVILETLVTEGYVFNLPCNNLINVLSSGHLIPANTDIDLNMDVNKGNHSVIGRINYSFQNNLQSQFLYLEDYNFRDQELELPIEGFTYRITHGSEYIFFTPNVIIKNNDLEDCEIYLDARGMKIEEFADSFATNILVPMLQEKGIDLCNRIISGDDESIEETVDINSMSGRFVMFFADINDIYNFFEDLYLNLNFSQNFDFINYLGSIVDQRLLNIQDYSHLQLFLESMSIVEGRDKFLWTFVLAIQDIYNLLQLANRPNYIFKVYNFTKIDDKILGLKTISIEIDAEMLPNRDISSIEAYTGIREKIPIIKKNKDNGIAFFYIDYDYLKSRDIKYIYLEGNIEDKKYTTNNIEIKY